MDEEVDANTPQIVEQIIEKDSIMKARDSFCQISVIFLILSKKESITLLWILPEGYSTQIL